MNLPGKIKKINPLKTTKQYTTKNSVRLEAFTQNVAEEDRMSLVRFSKIQQNYLDNLHVQLKEIEQEITAGNAEKASDTVIELSLAHKIWLKSHTVHPSAALHEEPEIQSIYTLFKKLNSKLADFAEKREDLQAVSDLNFVSTMLSKLCMKSSEATDKPSESKESTCDPFIFDLEMTEPSQHHSLFKPKSQHVKKSKPHEKKKEPVIEEPDFPQNPKRHRSQSSPH